MVLILGVICLALVGSAMAEPPIFAGGQIDARTSLWEDSLGASNRIMVQTDRAEYRCLDNCIIQVEVEDSHTRVAEQHLPDDVKSRIATVKYTDQKGKSQVQFLDPYSTQEIGHKHKLTFNVPYDIYSGETYKFNITYIVGS